MRDIGLALQDTLLAERVVITADTCHSGATVSFAGRRSAENNAEVVNQYLKSLSSAQKGIAYLTSAEAREISSEDAKWGGGHGVFTHYLLEGLRGKADRDPKDGIVTVGELFEYVREKVLADTGNKQHPYASEAYDRNLPIAITGGLAAREHYQLGCQLHTLGRILDDPGRYESAIRQFDEAIRLAQDLPEAYLERGRSRLALGRSAEAIEDFQQALGKDVTLTQAWLDLGLAYAKKDDDTASAIQALESFLIHHPNDDRAAWIREFIGQLQSQQVGNRFALLIGIGQYAEVRLNLKGPANDIPLMQDLLTQHYAFPAENIKILADAHATREGIFSELSVLQKMTKSSDIVLIYYSGHSSQGDTPAYLAPYDVTVQDKDIRNTVSAQELHEAINRIPARRKTVILDTHATYQMTTLASQSNAYTLFLATSPDKQAYETSGEKGKLFGVFTYALVQELEKRSPDTTQAEIFERVRVRLTEDSRKEQAPLFFGRKDQPLFSIRGEQDYIVQFDFSQRQNYAALSRNEIQRWYADLRERLAVPFPLIHYRFGQTFLEKGDYHQATTAFQTAIDQREGFYPEALIGLGIAQLRTQHYPEAMESLRTYCKADNIHVDHMMEPLALLERLVHKQKHALIVGIDQYPNWMSIRGAVNDCRELQQILIEKYGFQATHVKVLLNQDATTQAVINEFKKLVEQSYEEPALFYFAGSGSLGYNNPPAVVSFDLQLIELRELAVLAGTAATNLISIIDSGWSRGAELPWGSSPGSRFVPAYRLPHTSASRDLKEVWEPHEEWLKKRDRVVASLQSLGIGRLTIYPASIQAAFVDAGSDLGEAIVEAEFPALDGSGRTVFHGALTYAMVNILQKSDPTRLTYAQLKEAISHRLEWLQPYIIGDNLEEVVFGNVVEERTAQKLIHEKIFQEPIRQTISMLKRLIDQHDRFGAEAQLNLGIAFAALADYDKSIAALRNAIQEQDEGDYLEARYYLGRVLLESGRDLDGAVSELRSVKKGEPSNLRARYYLGQAIRARVEQESQALVEAEEDFQYYLNQGAPLGKQEEILQFLRSRKPEMQRSTR